ncbi:MAG TPA: N-acyl homoserine lactonase family protein [Vineibacter sp.]|nr:N-acyl homoserine lactonase family protein [Vineibacter sp.]
MSMKMYALTCGSITGRLKDMIEGEEGPVQLPIPSYLIEHPKGTVLFDTGMHPQLQTDAATRLGERVVRIFNFDAFRPGDEVNRRLEAIDRDPAKVHFIVNSHLHFDHCGGNQLIPNATVVVQRREWQAAQDPETAAKVGFFRQDFDHGHKLLLVDGEHDLFGDGRVVCLPTHGHTPGHQSLKVRLDTGDIVLAGDACYFCRTLRERRLPRFVYDRDAMLGSLDRLAALERGGARIFFGHDPEFWKGVPQAPAAIL